MEGLSRISDEMMRIVREARIQQDVEEEIALAAHDLYRKAHGKVGYPSARAQSGRTAGRLSRASTIRS